MEHITIEELELRALQTVNTCDGIQPMHTPFYTLSIGYSAERCLSAFDLYEHLLESNAEPAALISAVQEAIGHAGALSRYFWPSPSGKRNNQYELKLARVKKLRDIYKVNEDSPLANRELRNAWEHFDEKLDSYVLSNDAGYFFPTPVMGSHTLADDPTGKIFKLIDPHNHCLVLLGKKFFFEAIRCEVENIFARTVE
jgi:hypothetical protein